MKVGPSDIIRISGKSAVFSLLHSLKPGSEQNAKIIDRPGGNTAVIEIAGKRVRAEFLKGVPGSNSIVLKLDERSGNTLFFKIISPTGREGFIEKLSEFLVMEKHDISAKILPGLSRFLSGNIPGIFELNRFFLGDRYRQSGHSLTDLLNGLLKAGMSKEDLLFLSGLISMKSIDPNPVLAVLNWIGRGKDTAQKFSEREKLKDDIDAVLREVMGNNDKSIEIIIEIMLDSSRENSTIHYAEIPYFDSGNFQCVQCIYGVESLIFFLDLSGLGVIELLIRLTGKDIYVSIFSGNDTVVDELNAKKDELSDALGRYYSGAVVTVFKMKQVMDKIVEINSYYSINSAVDIKI